MGAVASLVILSYLALFVLASSENARGIVYDHELRSPYKCPPPLLSGSSSYTFTLPHPYHSITPIIGNFACVDWEYDLTNKSFPPSTTDKSAGLPDPPSPGHYNEAPHPHIPAIAVTINAFTSSPGLTRFYTLPHTNITIVEALQALEIPPAGPFNLVHTTAPIYLPRPLNLTIGSPFSETSAIPVCKDRATKITFATDFCASDVAKATVLLGAKFHGASTGLRRLLVGQNFTTCEDLEKMPETGTNFEWANVTDVADVAPSRPDTAEDGVEVSNATTLRPQPTDWSDRNGENTLETNLTSDSPKSTYMSTVAWWKMFGVAATVTTATTVLT